MRAKFLFLALEVPTNEQRAVSDPEAVYRGIEPGGSPEQLRKAGDIVQDEGQLYRSIHDVKDAGQNTKPSATPSMWTRIGNPLEEFPEWIQPIGAHDAYDQGAKVTHNGKRWVSSAASNVWEPGVYGWEEYQEPEPAQEAPQEAQDGPGEPEGE